MSNYRRFKPGDKMTPRQARRFDRKFWRDEKLALIEGYEDRNPTRPAGLSGHPGRRRAQLAEIEGRSAA